MSIPSSVPINVSSSPIEITLNITDLLSVIFYAGLISMITRISIERCALVVLAFIVVMKISDKMKSVNPL